MYKLEQTYNISSGFDNIISTGNCLYKSEIKWITNMMTGEKYKNMGIIWSWKNLIAMSNGLIINLDTDQTIKIKTNTWNDFYITNNGYIVTIECIYTSLFEMLDFYYDNIIEIYNNKVYLREYLGIEEIDLLSGVSNRWECHPSSTIFVNNSVLIICEIGSIKIYNLESYQEIKNHIIGVYFKPMFSGRFLHIYYRDHEMMMDCETCSLEFWKPPGNTSSMSFINDTMFSLYDEKQFSFWSLDNDDLISQFNKIAI